MKNKENESVGYLFYLQKCLLLKMTCDCACGGTVGFMIWVSVARGTALRKKAFGSLGVYCVVGTGQVC